ncbi:hypothetical protein D4L85_31790 [Chryseolinea soli]|uniref:Uncharacterized protein n=1 Tax=Chryseolinea soli TaxID=2321403 RepID=A0A385SVC1_9BACT|nr:hypothetical protein D4L85_31790 [Chryseolinea soli]
MRFFSSQFNANVLLSALALSTTICHAQGNFWGAANGGKKGFGIIFKTDVVGSYLTTAADSLPGAHPHVVFNKLKQTTNYVF